MAQAQQHHHQAAAAVVNNGKIPDDQKALEIPEIIFNRVSQKKYQRGRFLGKGGFARCYEITEMGSSRIYACKIVNKNLLIKQHQRDKMAQEISIHRDLKHDYIVDFQSYFEDDLNVYIILELCAKKSLMELQKRRKTVTEIEARYFLKQIMEAVNYLHEKNIIHRDLKLGNIFVNENMNLKLGDFGLATTIEYNGERKKTLCGTPNYIAPEVLSKKGHSFEVDIWSIGCILYTLLVGKPPFETNTLKDTYAKIKRGDYFIPSSRMTPIARNLIQKMLQVDPTLRPTAKQVLTSEFITKNYIPSCLPASCLTMPPRFDHRASYAHAPSAATKRPLLEHNPRSPAGGPSSGGSGSSAEGKNRDQATKSSAAQYMKMLHRQVKSLLEAEGTHKRTSMDDDAEDPNSSPLLWIAKWVDYSDKYGFGYQLSDDSIGVSFNDLTRMVLLPDGINMHYIDKNGNEKYYTKDEYPVQDLQKKVKLLNYFQQYMSENLLRAGGHHTPAETAQMTRLPNMWTWFRTSRAVVMVLTNGTLQINNFRDHTKMILCPLMGAITLLEHNKPMRTFKFSLVQQYGCTSDLRSKLQYALEKLEVVIGTKCPEPNNNPTAKQQATK